MTLTDAHDWHSREMYGHQWTFRPWQVWDTVATRHRDDDLTDARDTLATLRDKEAA